MRAGEPLARVVARTPYSRGLAAKHLRECVGGQNSPAAEHVTTQPRGCAWCRRDDADDLDTQYLNGSSAYSIADASGLGVNVIVTHVGEHVDGRAWRERQMRVEGTQ